MTTETSSPELGRESNEQVGHRVSARWGTVMFPVAKNIPYVLYGFCRYRDTVELGIKELYYLNP